MILIDSSAWIEFFRGTGSPQDDAVVVVARPGETFKTCGPVTMEILAGARSDADIEIMRKVLGWGTDIPCDERHFEDAAVIYRTCRERGITVRSMVDCLIASIAMSDDAEVLHHDRDFNAIAQVFPLRVHPASLQ